MSGIFSVEVLYGLLAGSVAGGGFALLIVAIRGWAPKPGKPGQGSADKASELARFLSQRGSLAVVAGLVVLGLTRWIVLGIATAVLVFSWNKLFGGAAEERAAMKRVEALAGWTESLRDTIAGAVGLEQAIPASARAAAPALRPHLAALVNRLRSRTPLPDALQHLADEINDASADVIVAALILNSRLRGPGLREVLGALAKSAREEVDMRQRVMAQRASTRRSVQIVVIVSVGFVLGLAIFNRSFVEPYGTAIGQLVLAVVCGLFAAGFWWLRSLAKIDKPERFLVHAPERLGQRTGPPGQFGPGHPLPAHPLPGRQLPGQQLPDHAAPGRPAPGPSALPGQGASTR
ncbi:Flp pilus assembly protein TadB [Streptomyces sp. DvalAA-14]|uniref:type II secretion system F family protein n=1 Tax=unclassified Streptomyces TaxID=2593676 RepID=UPI00081B18BA|nr:MULTISPECIES: type II secretion system F family protein [unclassified Streptomyces]MYS24373.1 type II secretion system protein [Streptomyces sp. SID4948]SCE45387.1 Flp pilus assembly protein TadB [Streptomyces sp. DvalAA-14]